MGWFAYERGVILGTAKSKGSNLVVIAGDTHNAWANELSDAGGDAVGVEFATSSVSSPGLEFYLGIPADQQAATEAGVTQMVDGLQYTNLRDRGFMILTFTAEQVRSDWHFVDSIESTEFSEDMDKRYSAVSQLGSAKIMPV